MSLHGDRFWVERAELRRRSARKNFWTALLWVAVSGIYIALSFTGWIAWLTFKAPLIAAAFWLVIAAVNVWFAYRNLAKARAYDAEDAAANKSAADFDERLAAVSAPSTSVLDLGDAPVDQREDGSIRKGDPAFDFMMRAMESGGVVHAQRRDDGKWDVAES